MNGPQFRPRTHPAKARLDEITPRARWLYELIDKLRADRAGEWPASIYCPSAALVDVVPEAIARIGGRAALLELLEMGPLGLTRMIDPLITMATWRMTQGIYRIDAALYPALVETPMPGDIPATVLQQLPEWCVYVETPGLTTSHASGAGIVDVLGAWARIDQDADDVSTLVLALNVPGDQAMVHQHIPLRGSLRDSIQSVFDEWRNSPQAEPELKQTTGVAAVLTYAEPVLNLLLYIASTTDYSRRGQDLRPANPLPVRTRRNGVRLFAADGPAEWDVGVRLGAAMRRAYQAQQTGTKGEHAGPRAHIRVAHWHGFRSGPRKRDDGSDIPASARPLDVRWMPPIAVNLDDLDDLPATVRPVK